MAKTDAIFSPDRVYRYALFREWEPGAQMVIIGLNPSTADETEDDPTIRRCIGFAKREGCGGLIMLNIFALRATDPKVMLAHPYPVGPENADMLRIYGQRGIAIAAWGAHGSHLNQAANVCNLVPNLHCFGVTKTGQPKHPLYLKADTRIIPFNYVKS